MTVIAIDGPAASGKTTVGKLLAEALGYLFLDTGCMYRAATLAVLQQGVDVEDETAVTHLTHTIDIDIQPINGKQDGRQYTVMLNGNDVTWEIRSPQVDANVSQVSTYHAVRQEMVRRQRDFGKRGKVIMVGRDIGTVVMPDAPLKLYVNASPEERARRRWRDRSQQGHTADYSAILADVIRRDKIDSGRKHSPLRPATDALHIDSTSRSATDIAEEIAEMVRNLEAISN
ncbi:MAG: (d)CMP kinase [Chloroflexi bacterium]|nr:MAG: (d)CMP kinase [Chloroflexota bacterium]